MVERIANYTYIKKGDVTDLWLTKYGFMYDKISSDRDDPAYSLRFPVYKYGGLTLLDGCVTIYPNHKNEADKIKVNCYEHGSRSLFARFYYWEYGKDDDIMRIVNGKIKRKMKELNIQVIEPDGKEHDYEEVDELTNQEENDSSNYY